MKSENEGTGFFKRLKIKHVIIAIVIVLFFKTCVTYNPKTDEERATIKKAERIEEVNRPKNDIGQNIESGYFLVTVHSAKQYGALNEVDLPRQEGSNYMVIDVSFKNLDKETRTVMSGAVIIKQDGDEYTFESTEPVLMAGDDWGLLFEPINPMLSKRTKLVFKIPSEMTGKAYYRLGSTGKDKKIYLGLARNI